MFHITPGTAVLRYQIRLVGIPDDGGYPVTLAKNMGAFGECDVMVCSDGTIYVNGADDTQARNHIGEYDVLGIQAVPIRPNGVPGGALNVHSTWVTHFRPYHEDNLDLDEFTIRCEVTVPSNATTFPVTIGEIVSEETYGFTVDLLNYVDPGDDYRLEWKFINYIAHFYIDGMYMYVCYDFENNLLRYVNVDPEQTIQDTPHVYSRCPLLLGFQYSDAYYMPGSDYPEYAVPQKRQQPTIKLTVREGVTLYTAQFGEGDNIHVDIQILDTRGIPVTTMLQIREYGRNVANPDSNQIHNVQVNNGVATLVLPGSASPLTLRLRAQNYESWMVAQSNTEIEVPILITPLLLTLSIVSPTSVVYTSPTRDVTIRATLSIDPSVNITGRQGFYHKQVNFYDGDGALIASPLTDQDGVAEIQIPIGNTPVIRNIRAEYVTTGLVYTGDDDKITLETVQNVAKFKCTYKSKIAVNKSTPFKVKVTDQYGDSLVGARVAIINTPRGISFAGTTDENGEITTTIPAQVTPGQFNIEVYMRKTDYTSVYRQYYVMSVLDVHVNVSSTYSQSINKSDIQNTGTFPFTVSIVEDGEPVTTGKLGVYQVHGGGRTFKKYITVDSASITDSININDYDESNLVIEFTYIKSNSPLLSEYYEIPIIDDILTDPLDDADFFDLGNWGMFASNVSGSGLTATPTSATSSVLSVSDSNKTVTDTALRWFIYDATLYDLLQYYNNEFSLVLHKTGGDGRYDFGFINTTTGGYRIAYTNGAVVSEETSSNNTGQEVEYQQWNEFTFKLVGTDLHIYFKRKSNYGYADITIPTYNINLYEYKLYFKSYNKAGLSISTDMSKIQNASRQN